MLGGGLADVEEIAKTTAYPNDMPYNRVEDKLADAVREKYMTPNFSSIPKITWDPKYTPREFLERAKEQWMSQTAIHPGQEGEHRAWFRAAVLKGLPDKVTTDLETQILQWKTLLSGTDMWCIDSSWSRTKQTNRKK